VKTYGLITSELILIGDYRTLGLSNPRIVEPSDYRYIALCFIEPELLPTEFLHSRNRDFRPVLLP